MPRNGTGQYVLPPLNPVQPNTIIATAWANSTLDDIALALSTSISTDGQTVPTANLPMAGFRHTNVGAALSPTQYARADQVQAFVFGIVTNVACLDTVSYTGQIPFGVGNSLPIPNLMPIIFVPSVNNGGPSTLALNGGAAAPILNADLTPLTAAQIKVNHPYALCFSAGNWILITNTLDLTQLNAQFVKLAGGTMTGPLILSGDPSLANGAATKHYVDISIAGSIAGVASFNTRTGIVTLLSSDVTAALSYTPANIAGSTFTGNISAPNITATNRMSAKAVDLTPVALTPTTGAVTIDLSTGQNFTLNMTGNVTLSITNPPAAGNIFRLALLSTTGRTVTWPGSTFWPQPTATAPVIDAGPAKYTVVVFQYSGSAWFANAAVY